MPTPPPAGAGGLEFMVGILLFVLLIGGLLNGTLSS